MADFGGLGGRAPERLGRAVRTLHVLLLAIVVLLSGLGCSSARPYEGLAADELFEWAEARYEARDWDDAVEALERFLSMYPAHGRQAEARYLLAQSFLEREEELSAVSEFERFLQRWPVHALTPRASLGICEAYARLSPIPQRDQRYTHRAREACERTMLEFANHEVASEAEEIRWRMLQKLAESEYLVGQFYQRRSLYDSAIISYERVIERYPNTEWAPKALLATYRSYLAIGWEQEAEEAREELLSLFPESEEADQVRSEASNGDDR